MIRRIVTVIAAAAFLVACGGTSKVIVHPEHGNPCGYHNHVCFNMAGTPNGACCADTDTCGGGKWSVGCPVDSCCFIEQNPNDLGARLPTKQRKIVEAR